MFRWLTKVFILVISSIDGYIHRSVLYNGKKFNESIKDQNGKLVFAKYYFLIILFRIMDLFLVHPVKYKGQGPNIKNINVKNS